ncbi:hypothetical protein HanRHA438_Chr09g0395071 [Helianthus annuus]|uniref:Uncharacterized protein n=1 Tax=Helianthus annuus TaxID=4232 RepID=A0A9K3I6G8_HELAN|nr:hypothetical protein HanXRQr2_Chr09g0383441 [Helianthus annuus]KAJ0533890.1 hypothetical protein HanIR_Chr09g0413611 [Helianthus annuus]KAJ0887803.1 hypothetical protein HanRHA438_Chr09g0395071 [Helianthus annuus]KAJ0892735.1 hypothetical protein HanPSC8_Chr09g0369521 [Helianthus annuus]
MFFTISVTDFRIHSSRFSETLGLSIEDVRSLNLSMLLFVCKLQLKANALTAVESLCLPARLGIVR